MSENIDNAPVDFSKTEEGKSFAAMLDMPETASTETKSVEPTPEPVKGEKPVVEQTKGGNEAAKEVVAKEPELKSTKTREHFDKLKAEKEAEIESLKAEKTAIEEKLKGVEPQASKVTELEKELVTLRETAKTAAQYKELAEKAKEYEEIIKRIDIKEDPSFKAKYNLPRQRIQETIKEYLGDSDQSKAYIDAFNLPLGKFRDERLEAAREEMTLSKQTKLVAYETQWEDINKDMQFELENAEIARGLYDEKRKKEVLEESSKRETIFNEAEQWARNNLVTYKKADGQDAFNADIEDRVQTAKRIALGQASPQEMAQAAIYAADYPRANRLIQILAEELAEMKKTVSTTQKSDPGVTAKTTTAKKEIDPLNNREALSEILDEVYAGQR